ncbi:carnitine O-palmitoyltransferase 1, liver isoform [Patella vulgata]|uniref:carnitine O-palmitoyltransferase 1, liver isoform n=1 Tax=Patella vulgata TaxID=6465 RepID=UPI0021801ED8|nr:carnitine O-palmitoyltransferase 1, liver isoform [Patella vulgata]
MAEARSAVTEPRVHEIEEGKDNTSEFYLAFRQWRRSLVRRFYRTRNLIQNGLWPTKIWNLGGTVILLTGMCHVDSQITKPITDVVHWTEIHLHIPKGFPKDVKSFLASTVVGFGFFIVLYHVRRYALRLLLSYRGWMYEPPKSQSYTTLMWGLLVKVISGSHPTLYSCQQSLPRMPVPPLKTTIRDLLLSLKPLYEDKPEEFIQLEKEAEEFQKTIGPKLQRVLVLKSWWAANWVSDWWEKYIYLMGRSPLPINSNYYVMDQSYWKPTNRQTSRAASSVYQLMLVKQKTDREQVEALTIRNTIPVCMAQYERVFSTTRIPGEDIDELVHYSSSESKHIVVLHKGVMYKVDVFDCHGKIIPPQILEKQFNWIVVNASFQQEAMSEMCKSIPALTCLDRTTAARVRQQHFKEGINKESLDIVERSIIFISLETTCYEDMSERAKFLLHGDGKNIWFEKSINLLFFTDGRVGLNCEHSFADAPVVAHLQEFSMLGEVTDVYFTPDGYVIHADVPGKLIVTKPERLVWDVQEDLASSIRSALDLAKKNNADLELCVRDHSAYGKGFIKQCKVSPDAFIQMALQLTYYKNAGKFCLTYEASMTRLYLQGRTETVRTLSTDTVEFVRAMYNKSVSREGKIALFRKACEKHQRKYKDAMNGKAFDRHLFALFVASRGLGYDCEFLKKALMMPWTLSTSQQPQTQISWAPDCSLPQYSNKLSPGGGFGPVSDNGYGVSYMLPGNNKFFFHVSSKKCCNGTNAARFMDQLFESLQEIKTLFEGEEMEQKKDM